MTKRNKTICLDEEMIDLLKGNVNSSSLINELLKNYFGKGSLQAKEEVKAKLAELRKEVFEKNEIIIQLEDQLDSIRDKERDIEDKFKSIPKDILDDFKCFPNLTEESLINRYRDIYIDKYKISYEQLKEAYDLYYVDNA